MKTNFKRIGKQSISIVLAVMMMLSTMLVGMVTSNAAISYWVLRGTFNDWKEIQFGGADGGSITYDLSAYKGTTVEFRTDAYENNKLNKNSTGDIVVAGTQYQLTWGKGDTMKYTVSSTGTGKVTFTVISQNGNNYLTVTEGDQPITVTPYYVAGETSLVNGPEAWKAAQENDEMSYDETTKKYSITYDKKAAGTYKFKIIEGSNTWHGYNDFTTVTDTGEICTVSDVDGNDHNIQIVTTEESNITITLDATNKKLTISAEPATQKYNITVASDITNGTVTTSATSPLAAGEKFTVTATPGKDYVLDTVTVKDESGNPITADADGSYTMPASNVTVSATFKVKTDAKFSVTYIDPTGSEGVVSASIEPTVTTLAAGLAAGATVKVTVTVKEGYTASLAVDGAKVTTSTSGNTYTFTFLMPAKDITVAPQVTKAGENTDTKIQDLYLIYTTANDGNPTGFTEFLNLYYDSNNQVYAYFKDTEDTKFDTSKTYKFMISTLTGENSFEGTTNYNKDNYNVNVATTDDNSIQVGKNEYGYSDNHRYFYGWFSVKNPSQSTVSSVKINLGYYNKTTGVIQENATDTSYTHSYEVIPISGVEGMVQVFAKDGTIRATYQKYADMADTVLTAENTADLTKYNNENEYYETAYAKVGTKLKITTTIDDKYKDTYFVKAFSINGYSYGIIDASQAKKQNGVYTCEYTIPEDFEGSRIEITPIYYYIDDKDTVTFYVEGFDEKVQKMWGNTVAVQAWYANCEKEDDESNSKFDSLTKNALGGYPGQPLVYEGGKYSMQIPKYLNGNKANTVSGITLNNYFWDDIHKQNFSDKSNTSKFNCQTYDYDDFYKLSDSPDVDNIIFDFRYRTTTDNDPKNNLASSTYNESELEPLKDYSGNIVDIFGNILSEKWTTDYDNKYLTVISDGYKKNYIGKYATEWSVYDHYGNRIAQINCSNLIDKNKVDSTYKEAYEKLESYVKYPVKIAYEKSNYYSSDDIEHKGTRADGRWYFSKKEQKITANVQIQYRTDDNSPFIEDPFATDSNVGKNTGAKAYFTNADYNGKTTCQGTVDGGNFSVHAQTDADANYYFIGWYLKTSDGYSFITNESDTNFPMTNNETYVARFIKTPSGTLTLSHTLLDGSADGKTFIKADIIDSNNIVKASIAETSGNLVIPSKYVTYTSTYSIRLTLRTVPYGNDTVEGFYEGYSSDKPVRYNKDFTGTGEQTYTVTREIKSLFKQDVDAEGNVLSYSLIKSNIPFYSNINSNPINYQITYVYFTRLDDQQIYVIKDTVSGIELEEMWAANEAAGLNKEQLSKAFITKKAPFVSNYREEITWDMDHAIIDHDYTATVFSNTKTVNPKISALTVAGSWTLPTEVEYGTLAKSNGDYLYKTGTDEFPETFNYSGTTYYDFSFWAIFDNPDAAKKYSAAVAEYMSGTPDKNMSNRLTKLTNLEGYKNLITKSYSKEYNYVSYQNYYIVPVYADRFAKEDIEEAQASIRLLEYTRNQWTNANGVKGDGSLNVGGSKTDYLYTDFALSFDKDQLLIKENTNIKVGIAFEIVAKYDAVKDDLKSKSFETPSNTAAIGDKVKAATANGKVGTYEMDGASRSIYRYEINNSDISVKNRIEYYLQFKNNNNAQQNVMKVYSYIYDTVSGKIYLSDPVYMNMYDIGNLTYITSDLASIDLQPATELG